MFGRKKLVSCDVQPRYATGVPFKLEEFVEYLNKFDDILYLFNDKNINVPDTVDDVKKMLASAGASSELLNRIKFRPKVYFYFRDILDSPTTTYEECVKLLKMMILRGVENASELSTQDLSQCLSCPQMIKAIKSGARHFYYDPSLATDLSHYDRCTEVGGFENQCNIEITLYLDALGISYEKNYKFIF
jgi:hypothetical protein